MFLIATRFLRIAVFSQSDLRTALNVTLVACDLRFQRSVMSRKERTFSLSFIGRVLCMIWNTLLEKWFLSGSEDSVMSFGATFDFVDMSSNVLRLPKSWRFFGSFNGNFVTLFPILIGIDEFVNFLISFDFCNFRNFWSTLSDFLEEHRSEFSWNWSPKFRYGNFVEVLKFSSMLTSGCMGSLDANCESLSGMSERSSSALCGQVG